MRILVIEDNQDIAANLGDYLEDRGHTVDFAADGITGLHLAVVHDFDAIVLDLNLPGMDGLEVCRKLRGEARKQTPVLMLTARDSLDNKIAGFDSGADDYLIKPVSRPILLARLNAVLRRSGLGQEARKRSWGRLEVDFGARQCFLDSKRVDLTERETDFAMYLLQNVGRLLTRSHLMLTVWAHSGEVESRKVDVHASALRRKLELAPENGWRLVSIYGQGYRLEWLHDSP